MALVNKIYLRPGIYIISTPIGNMSDITLRALDTINSVELLYAEDTRISDKLLKSYGINKKLISYHKYSDKSLDEDIIDIIRSGKSVGLISDCGTPNIADPGESIITMCYENKIDVYSVPGPSSLTAAMSISPYGSHNTMFIGFLPKKDAEIKEYLDKAKLAGISLIYFDSPKRVRDNLKKISNILDSEVKIAIFKEITKIHEKVAYGTISDILSNNEIDLDRGEFIVMLYINKNI